MLRRCSVKALQSGVIAMWVLTKWMSVAVLSFALQGVASNRSMAASRMRSGMTVMACSKNYPDQVGILQRVLLDEEGFEKVEVAWKSRNGKPIDIELEYWDRNSLFLQKLEIGKFSNGKLVIYPKGSEFHMGQVERVFSGDSIFPECKQDVAEISWASITDNLSLSSVVSLNDLCFETNSMLGIEVGNRLLKGDKLGVVKGIFSCSHGSSVIDVAWLEGRHGRSTFERMDQLTKVFPKAMIDFYHRF